MAKGLNRATLIGNLGKDPEMRTTPQGKQVCKFSLATTESYKDANGQWQEVTEWHNIVMWERHAETAGQYLRKGSRVYLEGKIQTRSYEKDGITRYFTEINAMNMIMLDGRREEAEAPASSYTKDTGSAYDAMASHLPPEVTAEEDDVPF
jgi:single-strand DNA-binding protein